MYFKEKGNTNIDSEFKSKNNFSFDKIKWPLMIGIGVIFFVVLIFILVNNRSNVRVNYFIELIGEEEITIYRGNDYIEPGYQAYDNKNNNLNNEVDINSNLDINKIGNYEVVYSIGSTSITRYIKVVEKPKGATYIYLRGKSLIYLNIGDKYTEPGYIVIDTVDSNLTDKVKVTNNIDISKMGTYQVIYSVVNSSGVTTSVSRTVIVIGNEINLSLSTNNYTNSSVKINISVSSNYFNYLVSSEICL